MDVCHQEEDVMRTYRTKQYPEPLWMQQRKHFTWSLSPGLALLKALSFGLLGLFLILAGLFLMAVVLIVMKAALGL
jgi:hypothetical protein